MASVQVDVKDGSFVMRTSPREDPYAEGLNQAMRAAIEGISEDVNITECRILYGITHSVDNANFGRISIRHHSDMTAEFKGMQDRAMERFLEWVEARRRNHKRRNWGQVLAQVEEESLDEFSPV